MLVAHPQPPHEGLVHHGDAAARHRPDRQLGPARRAQLADDEHVERGVQGGGDLGGDRDTTARQAEDDGLPVRQASVQGRRERAPGGDPVGELHRLTSWCS